MNGGRNGKVRRTAFQTASGPGTSDRPGPGLTVYAQLAGIVLFWGANWPLMKQWTAAALVEPEEVEELDAEF